MITRARGRMDQQRQAESEGESELNETIIQGANTPIRQQPMGPDDRLTSLVNSITALRESIIELRNDTNSQRADIQQLRQRMDTEAGGAVHRTASTPYASGAQEAIVHTHPQQSSSSSADTPQPHTQSNYAPVLMDSASTRIYPLPVFEGCAEDWPLFFACYNDTTREFNYSNRQNLIRLQKALRGEAKRAVMSLLIHPENVPNVLSELQFNFGRPELLVRSQLNKVQSFANIPETRLDMILELASKVRNIVAFFKSANCEHHLTNPTLLESLIAKLPPSKQFEWSRRAAEIMTYPTVEMFAQWLSELARVVALMPKVADRSAVTTAPRTTTQSTSNRQPIPGGGSRRLLHAQEMPQRRQQRCALCSQGHQLTECQQFTSNNVNERWTLVKRHQLCFGCLAKGHNLLTCQRRVTCGINGCQRKHHQLLHAQNEVCQNAAERQVERVYNCQQESQSALFKILPVTLIGPRGKLDTYAMIDEGSSISLIDDKVAHSLGLQGQSSLLSLQWYGENKTTEKSKRVTVEIRGQAESQTFTIKNVRTIANLNLPTQSFNKNSFDYLKSVQMPNYANATPDILLGLDNSFLGIAHRTVYEGPSQLVAAKTKLGWTVYGPSDRYAKSETRVMVVREPTNMKQLHKLVEEYITGDTLILRLSYSDTIESDDDSRARKILADTTKYDGRSYEVGLLWRKDDIELPDSFVMASKRLQGIEARMKKDAEFALKYKREINKYINKGYERQLSDEEASIIKPTTWYLPHFGVVNAHKPEKLRIVFDAAANVSNVSLNSVLLKGPEKVQSLLSILFKFRQGAIAVAGDIEEMFSQVRIRAEDQDSQRFLWRGDDFSQPVRVYTMSSMMFGAACSPCCAEHIKNLNALKFASQLPKGVDAVMNKTYVDDLVISFNNLQEAEKTVREAIYINAAARFRLRKFISNDKVLQASLNGEDDTARTVVNMERQPTADKILGMFWSTTTDTFRFEFKFVKVAKDILRGQRAPTKRELLGIVMSIYDPFGFLSYLTITAKLILQTLWKENIMWDEELPPQLVKQWNNWWLKFQAVNALSVPRCYSPLLAKAENVQLHIFVDASTSAYAAVAYIRVEHEERVEATLVCAKAVCAPIKPMTVPRLELQAAVLGTRLQTLVKENHEFQISNTTFWTDSQTVIMWIRSHSRSYKPFVKHRLAEILATTTVEQWHWVPTALNVADDATRAMSTNTHPHNTRWFCGPEFLHQDEEHWPQETTVSSVEDDSEEIITRRLLVCESNEKFINFSKFSSFLKLVRVVGWILRFINNVRNEKCVTELRADELIAAENWICQMVQREVYSREIELLRNKIAIPKDSTLYALTPYLDDTGLLRVYGRIDSAYCLPLSARRPIILPPRHHVTSLLVGEHHKMQHHQNEYLTINEIRQRYWIPSIRSVLKSVKRECPVCIQDRAKPAVPLMGQLPADRLTPYVRPFTYSGVDYCGPFNVAVGRRREKRWIALFTCLTTRAVHLELSENLSTDAFIICFRNFVNRRGVPMRMRSDNGTNFVGAQKEMKESERIFDFSAIEREMAKRKIEWIFNCPTDPESGGCWERLIRCTKRLLHKVLTEEAPRVETLRSVIIEIENIINSRPLTDLPISPAEDEPLTPNHFLLGCLNSTQTPHPEEERACPRKQWKIAQNLKDRAWKRWTVEYLPRLLCRSKWRDDTNPLAPGTVVIVCDPAASRSQWQKGKVVEVFKGKDGRARSADVQTSHGILRRPIRRLAALNICESTDDPPGGGMLSTTLMRNSGTTLTTNNGAALS